MFKSCRQPLTGFFLLRAAFFTFIVGGALPAHSQDFPAPQILRTLVHHQITSFQQDLALSAPVLSGNGNRIAFTDGPGTGSADKPNRIYAINADGTDQKEIDSYTSRCFCGSYVDISDDGSKVVSTDSVQLRIANADGSGAKSLVVLDSNEINDMKISGDGTKVFFRIYRNNGYLGPNGTDARTDIENGIWVVNADGTGLRQLVGRVQLAAVQGVQPGDLGFWATIHPFTSLDVSTDGSRIVFGTFNRAESGGYGQSVYGVNLDGTGLRQLLDRQGWVWNVALSADGSKVGYNASPVGVDSSLNEVGIMNFDGSERKPLFTKTDTSALQVSADGSKLFVGGSSYLLIRRPET
jgi:dipeptidyl aminopeptidase/acylaminoacyl peptidase